MKSCEDSQKGFTDYPWQYAYKTSSVGSDGRAVNILHDFYIPVLRFSVKYDRVAGYFRSSSLAAASQGFSAFAAAGGQMRLIVGADLDEADVLAVLEGDTHLMSDRLNAALGDKHSWPVDVARGVELLAWMVSKGILEVRVAFRLHKDSGKPLALSAVDDGYVHEKWGIFTDPDGRRIYIAGSLNESQNALIHNAENIDVHADWWNDLEYKRAETAEAEFEDLWNNKNPHMRVMKLPEAVKEKIIKIGTLLHLPLEIDGTTGCKPEVEPPSAIERLRFALIKDGPKLPLGRYVGMATAPITPWPHQEVVARRLVETWPYSYLLCDEVGLGKTIEAGLAIRSLHLSGIAKRILISPPASLTRQWQREMASKFFMPFGRALTGANGRHEYIYPFEKTVSSKSLYQPDLSIVSTGLLSRKDRHADLQSAGNFDIVLIDEAHYARRKDPRNGNRSHPQYGNLYRTLSGTLRKKSRSMILATATPMQLDWIEVFDLLLFTQRVGPFLSDPRLTWTYYEALGNLVENKKIEDKTWQLLRGAISSLSRLDPFLKTYLDQWVIDSRIRATAKRWLNEGRIPSGADCKNILRLIFSAAPLSRVMLRHTRPLLELYREKGQLGANLAKREILPFPVITMSEQEKKAYEEFETYCKDLTKQIADNSPGQKVPTSLGFYLSFLRLRFASSLFSIRETLRRRIKRVQETLSHLQEEEETISDAVEFEDLIVGEDDEGEQIVGTVLKNRTPEDLDWERKRLEEMLKTLDDISGMPSKMKELLQVLNLRRLMGGRMKQTVIFSRFYDSLQDIVDRLRKIDKSLLLGTYSGKGGQYVDPQTKTLRGTERDEIKHRFLRGEIDVLICTDAAAEGLNLQTADLLINYDLPWNPMKVEQRIGRIDRIGQKHDTIHVLNLCYVDSAEQIVYDRLLKRLQLAGYVVGAQQVSLLPVMIEEFCDLAAGVLKIDDLEVRAKERIVVQRKRTDSMEIAAKDLYTIYDQMRKAKLGEAAPIDLDAIWDALSTSKYLRDIGCTLSANEKERIMTIRGLDDVFPGTLLTVDRDIYEKGKPDATGPLHFASYGDPAFDAILDKMSCYDLPPCIARLTENVQDLDVNIVAYAVPVCDKEGNKITKLVTSWQGLKDKHLDEAEELAASDLPPLQKQLHELVRMEFDPTRAVPRLEMYNQRAAVAQSLWNLLAARSLLTGDSEDDNYWAILKTIDELLNDRKQLMISDLPAELLREIKNELIFDISIPNVGDKATVTVPIAVAKGSIDESCRLADAMKVKKAELSLQMIKTRIDREASARLKLFKALQS